MSPLSSIIDKKIKSAKKVVLFFHESPDGDTLGSCFGMMEFIKEKYNIPVRIHSTKNIIDFDFFKYNGELTDNDFIEGSLGIVLDCANLERIVGKDVIELCNDVIRIDHHPKTEKVCDCEWIDDTKASTCEMVCELILEIDEQILNKEIAKYLYAGLVTDTGRFLYLNNTEAAVNDFYIAKKLAKTGINFQEIYNSLYLNDVNTIKYTNYLTSLIKFNINKHLAFLVIPKFSHKKYKIIKPSSYVYLMSGIKDIDIWTSIYYDEESKKWKGSIRSRKYDISIVAKKYGGGGHKLASGFKIDDQKQFKNIINDLYKII